MFWSDWGKRPLIARSKMDGTNAVDFVNTNIHWPNGVAIDYSTERLYWADAKLMSLESIKLDGTDRRVRYLFNFIFLQMDIALVFLSYSLL